MNVNRPAESVFIDMYTGHMLIDHLTNWMSLCSDSLEIWWWIKTITAARCPLSFFSILLNTFHPYAQLECFWYIFDADLWPICTKLFQVFLQWEMMCGWRKTSRVIRDGSGQGLAIDPPLTCSTCRHLDICTRWPRCWVKGETLQQSEYWHVQNKNVFYLWE